ncbi:MAG TPA: OmpH family outer membrane protein [Gemmatimonadales bacterium]|nr:OmpH family outer membrane protein [Gemmatimonadales bacterium]
MTRSFGGALAGLLALTIAAASPLSAQGAKPGAARPAAAAAVKLGYVDTRLVLHELPEAARADSTWRKEAEGARAELNKLQASFDSAQTAYDQAAVGLSPSQRDARRKELDDLRTRSEQRAQQLQQQIAQRQNELLDPVQQRVMTAIEAVRREGGFAMIFDVASPSSSIVAADKGLDITDKVIARLKTAAK